MKQWLEELYDKGLHPYIATSENLLPYFDLSLFEGREILRLLEDPGHRNFHEAYLVSNSLAFGNPDLKMPNWVYIDCVLMQSAVVGFAMPKDQAPDTLVDFYEKDPWVDIGKLDYIPVSGQIAALGIDGKSLTGFSLFSLRRQLQSLNVPKIAHMTKYIALSAYRAEKIGHFRGISQYDNKALLTHALFGEKMYIEQPMMPLHPLRDMSFTYGMDVKLDEEKIFGESARENRPYDFLMRADDRAMKQEMQDRIRAGERFYIQEPIHIVKDGFIHLPVCVEKD